MSPAQASYPDFELHTLGWKAFQDLCVTVSGEVLGQAIESFHDSNDGGRDGAYYGKWSKQPQSSPPEAFTVQVKFSSRNNEALRLSVLSEELEKAKRLAATGLAEDYILMSNCSVTGRSEERIVAAFEKISGIKKCVVYGRESLTRFIRESARLRMLVPRIYGLGDLGQIIDHRLIAQAKDILATLGEDLSKFVITDAYRKSTQALIENGFLILLGEPACGKSTIAATLALGCMDEWECPAVSIRNADEFVAHFNPHQKMFYWIDDAFGPTQFDQRATIEWNKAFPQMAAAIKRGSKIVMTSRDYIYAAARNFLKQTALPVVEDEAKVVIRVEELSKRERQQILYNHIRKGRQESGFKAAIKPYLAGVSAHQHFSPEIARRLGNPMFTRNLKISQVGVEEFVSNPANLLEEIITSLDVHSRAALALIFMRGGAVFSPLALEPGEAETLALIGSNKASVVSALTALNNSLVLLVPHEGRYYWRYKHPTIRDAYAAITSQDRELMDIYLEGTPLYQLSNEITCGDVGIQGAKLIVPAERFPIILSRFQRALKGSGRPFALRFFGERCNREFLKLCIAEVSGFAQSLELRPYLLASADLRVVIALHKYGLLSEEDRKRHVERIFELAVVVPDSDWMNYADGLLTSAEVHRLRDHIEVEILDRIDSVIDSWFDEYDAESETIRTHMRSRISVLEDYRGLFSGDEAASDTITYALEEIDTRINRVEADQEEAAPPEPDDEYHERQLRSMPSHQPGTRSVFDDVDA